MRRRRAFIVFIVGTVTLLLLGGAMPRIIEEGFSYSSLPPLVTETGEIQQGSAREALEKLVVKGRAPKTGYERSQFGDGWDTLNGCSTREIILNRDLKEITYQDECTIVSGLLHDPYTGTQIPFSKEFASKIQIDHVVALSDAWQKGAQQLSKEARIELANDPLELLAVDGASNQQKSDGDAATWLPKNKAFRCEYVARQVAVKTKYQLWVTQSEKDAIVSVLSECPSQPLL